MSVKRIHLLIGPILYIILMNIPFEGLSKPGLAVLASTVWVAYWWITEALELAVTSLLPIVIFPLSGAAKVGDVTASYGHPFIFLFMGGFILGIAIQKWELHKRIAFKIIKILGTGQKKIILGFMVATAFLSMWISNSATAIMLLPIALSVTERFKGAKVFSKNLILSIAYGASIGGMASLIGSPPNIIFAGVVQKSLNIEITFLKWMLFALPLSIVLLIIAWLYLTRYKIREEDKNIDISFEKLGPVTNPEKRVLAVFVIVAFMWISKDFILIRFLPGMDDTIIAIMGAISFFIIPAGNGSREKLMDWKTAKTIPWGILLIFGAGLAIAGGFSSTDLTVWLGSQLSVAKVLPTAIFTLIIIASINFLTEITSNTATASMMLPVLIAIGTTLNMDVIGLLAGATLACSCAFMLPVATPPNAIVFSSGYVSLKQMMKAGIVMNIISIIVIFLFVMFASGLLST